jgi:prefoldin alpha subunit
MAGKEDELRDLAAQAQAHQQQMAAISNQLNSISTTMEEIAAAMDTLQNIAAAKEEVLLPIGAGTYMRAKGADIEHVVVNVGANIMSEKTIPEATEFLDKRMKTLNGLQVRLQRAADEVSKKLADIDLQARTLAGGMDRNVRPSQE